MTRPYCGSNVAEARRLLILFAVAGLLALIGALGRAPSALASCPNEAIRTEQHSTFLPDCRAYEQASPADKNGADAIPFSVHTRAAADGNALSFESLNGFGDIRGTGIIAYYFARRTGNGWITHAISPEVTNGSLGTDASTGAPFYDGPFSEDFEKGVVSSLQSLPDTPASVENNTNIYLRDDLGVMGSGHYELISRCPLCEETGEPLPPHNFQPAAIGAFRPIMSGATPDLAHIAFQSIVNLTADAPAQSPVCGDQTQFSPQFCGLRLYQWDHGVVRLASILPNGEPADSAFAATNALFSETHTPHAVSDGSDGHIRLFFTQPTDGEGHTFNEAGPLALTGVESGNLFVRVDGSETMQLNLSERTEPTAFAPAQYLEASKNGERVFLMTSQALTNDARQGVRQIYMYDTTKPPASPDNLTLISSPGESMVGTLGVSGDGSYVYMLGSKGVDLWHDGTLKTFSSYQSAQGFQTWLLTDGVRFMARLRESRVTDDGRYLVWPITQRIGLGYYKELYVYAADTARIACASCPPDGVTPRAVEQDDETTNQAANFIGPGGGSSSYENRALSDDGRYVFFNSPDALVERDTDGKIDAYEYDTRTREVSILSSGTREFDSYFVEADREGRNVFIATRDQLSGWDNDKAYDLYDARTGGGYPEPLPEPADCSGESCQGSQSAAPPPPLAGSNLQGSGNPKPSLRPKPCPKGQHRVKRHGKSRCVKSRHKHRAANDSRRPGR